MNVAMRRRDQRNAVDLGRVMLPTNVQQLLKHIMILKYMQFAHTLLPSASQVRIAVDAFNTAKQCSKRYETRCCVRNRRMC